MQLCIIKGGNKMCFRNFLKFYSYCWKTWDINQGSHGNEMGNSFCQVCHLLPSQVHIGSIKNWSSEGCVALHCLNCHFSDVLSPVNRCPWYSAFKGFYVGDCHPPTCLCGCCHLNLCSDIPLKQAFKCKKDVLESYSASIKCKYNMPIECVTAVWKDGLNLLFVL